MDKTKSLIQKPGLSLNVMEEKNVTYSKAWINNKHGG
jgi:hypothetical protein